MALMEKDEDGVIIWVNFNNILNNEVAYLFAAIVRRLASGYSVNDICEMYKCTPEVVEQARIWCTKVVMNF